MEISKTDLQKVITYLSDAAIHFRSLRKPRHQWRAELMKRLSVKLSRKLNDNTPADKH